MFLAAAPPAAAPIILTPLPLCPSCPAAWLRCCLSPTPQVNYRASSGYGKRFTNLGDKQWGIGTMQHDLTDSVKWAVEAGIADPKKVSR